MSRAVLVLFATLAALLLFAVPVLIAGFALEIIARIILKGGR